MRDLRSRLGRQACRKSLRVSPSQRAEDGFTLPELLIVLVIIPIIIGGLAIALIALLQNTVATDQHGTAIRLSNSHDAQITSAYFVRDVQSATSVSTAHVPLCAPAGSPNDQLLGLQWSSGNSTVSVSYFIQQAPLEIVRYFCSTGSVPQSTSVVSHDVFNGLASVAFLTCPAVGFGANSSVCAGNGATTYVAVVVDCTNDSGKKDCANGGPVSVVPAAAGGIGISGVHLYVLENTTTNFQYLLTGTPRLANGAQTGQPQSKQLNPPFIANGPVAVGNCNMLANGVAAINDSTSPAMTIGPTGSWSGTGLVTSDPNTSTAVSGSAGSYPTPVDFGPPVKSPYDVLTEPPSPPAGNPYPTVTETANPWDPSTDPLALSGGKLKPAIYVVQHGLKLSKGLDATNGVLFYVTGGNVDLGVGNANVLMTPLAPNWENPVPTGTPTPPEVVLWVSRNDTSPSNPPTMTLGGNGNATTINGAVYAPTAALTMNGGGSSGGVNAQSLDIGSIVSCNGGGSVPYNLTIGSPLSSGASVQPTSATISNGQSDSAAITVLGVGSLTPTGTVTFYQCGPLGVGIGCTSTANQVGGPVTLTASSPGIAKATSAAFTPSSAGTYCFAAYYSGNASYSPSSDTSTDGCFTVSGPPAPTILVPSSSASCYNHTGGGSCTMWPLAISGTAGDPGGPGVASVNIAIQDPNGLWWNGTSYSSSTPLTFPAADTSGTGSFSTWKLPYPLVNLPSSDKGTYTVVATITDKTTPTGVTGPAASQSFNWKG